jgi:5-methylcytosine-specific restriction endonuclease McrA
MANMTPRAKRNRRERVLATHGRVCHLCGEPIGFETVGHPRALTLDHVVAKVDGGSNAEENLRPAHYQCNHKRHH